MIEPVTNGYGNFYQPGQPKYEVTNVDEAEGSGMVLILWLDEAAIKKDEGQHRLAEVRCQLPSSSHTKIRRHSTPPRRRTIPGPSRNAALVSITYLNQVWNDLTVSFELLKEADGLYLELAEIHVF